VHQGELDSEALGKAHYLVGSVFCRGEGEIGPRPGFIDVQRGENAEAELAGKRADFGTAP
jgi:hypothetical protein